jgi:hypothetical protein
MTATRVLVPLLDPSLSFAVVSLDTAPGKLDFIGADVLEGETAADAAVRAVQGAGMGYLDGEAVFASTLPVVTFSPATGAVVAVEPMVHPDLANAFNRGPKPFAAPGYVLHSLPVDYLLRRYDELAPMVRPIAAILLEALNMVDAPEDINLSASWPALEEEGEE